MQINNSIDSEYCYTYMVCGSGSFVLEFYWLLPASLGLKQKTAEILGNSQWKVYD